MWVATVLQERGEHSAELLKTIVHQHRQLVPRLSSQTPTGQIEQLDVGMSRCAGGQQTSKSPTTLEQRR